MSSVRLLTASLFFLSILSLGACEPSLGENCRTDADCTGFTSSEEPHLCIHNNCISRSLHCQRNQDAPGCRNECGGLELLSEQVSAGDSCGSCKRGTMACHDINKRTCRFEPESNACGGCHSLAGQPGDTCGPCHQGIWTCDNGFVICEGAQSTNACGGCEPLFTADGTTVEVLDNHLCQTETGDDGALTCSGPNQLLCVPTDVEGLNACGGTQALEGLPATPCGICTKGRYICNDDGEAVRCSMPDNPLNACGGCSPLEGTPGSTCDAHGGVWTCNSSGTHVICKTPYNPCGGIPKLNTLCETDGQTCEFGQHIPGVPCGMGLVTYCKNETTLGCGIGPRTLCGGTITPQAFDAGNALEGFPPGTPCGPCGGGITRCITPTMTACVEEAEVNACGGCGPLSGRIGDGCALSHIWQCNQQHAECLPQRSTCSSGRCVDCDPTKSSCLIGSFHNGQEIQLKALWGRKFSYAPSVIYPATIETLEVTFEATNLPHWLSLDPSTGIITGVPDSDAIGSTEFQLFTRSTAGEQLDQQTIELSVRKERITDISAGYFHNCTLLETGHIRCWGNNQGQIPSLGSVAGVLGYGHTDSTSFYRPPGAFGDLDLGDKAIDICTGFVHSCAALHDGSVRCWGNNAFGQLGTGGGPEQVIGDNESPATTDALRWEEPIKSIECGMLHTCATSWSGDVYCWGNNKPFLITSPADDTEDSGVLGYPDLEEAPGLYQRADLQPPIHTGGSVKGLCAGTSHNCAILDNGTVQCWGDNSFGQLGTGTNERIGDNEHPDASIALPFPHTPTDIACGQFVTCITDAQREVYCWGRGGDTGYLTTGHPETIGDDELATTTSPLPLDSNYTHVDVDADGQTACAWNETRASCWGRGATYLDPLKPDSAPSQKMMVQSINIGANDRLVLQQNGVLMWFSSPSSFSSPTTSNQSPIPGFQLENRQPISITNFSPSPIPMAPPVAMCGQPYEFAVSTYADGDDISLQLLEGPDWLHLKKHLLTGTAPENNQQNIPVSLELSDGHHTEQYSFELEVQCAKDVLDIWCEDDRFAPWCCATNGSSKMACWGSGHPDQLDGTEFRLPPTNATTISTPFPAKSIEDNCVFGPSGQAICWGNNFAGQRGDGTQDRQVPLSESSTLDFEGDTVAVSASSHRCILLGGNRLACWGDNDYGQLARGDNQTLGDDERADSKPPMSIQPAQLLATGGRHTCTANTTNNTVTCWGAADALLQPPGEHIGDEPTELSGHTYTFSKEITALVAGYTHTCVLLDGQEVQCWGDNEHGQLNPEAAPNAAGQSFSSISFGEPVIKLLAGEFITCAMLTSETICWGDTDGGKGFERSTMLTPALATGFSHEHVISMSIHIEPDERAKLTTTGLFLFRADGNIELLGRHFWKCPIQNNSCIIGSRDPKRRFVDIDW